MTLTVTPIYAGFLALLLIALSARVIRHRHLARISVGDNNDKGLRKKMRVQANCAEYVPVGLLLLLLTELQGAPIWALHVLGATLMLGRLAHAAGMGATPQRVGLRIFGMAATLTMIGVTAIGNIAHALI
ncbi:MAG: MAPEG family protein [Pseudomonadota bacterium]